MSRRTFPEILKAGSINVRLEYSRLHKLMYEDELVSYKYGVGINRCTLNLCIDQCFLDFDIRKNALSLSDFETANDLRFEMTRYSEDEDYLISFCEFCINMCAEVGRHSTMNVKKATTTIRNQVKYIIEKLGYTVCEDENKIIFFVPKDSAATSVSELTIIPAQDSYKVIFYNHHSMKGDIERKKEIIRRLGDLLEPMRKELHSVNSSLEDLIFFSLNSCNIRHNNIDPQDKGKYKKFIAEMTQEGIESVYDELYQMILLAFLELDNRARKGVFEDLKKSINETK